jgi:hypothetical protein
MDAWQHFRKWVVPDYNNFLRSPSDFHLLENAILSMYAEVEYLGPHQRGYLPDVSGDQRDARQIRNDLNLANLQVCADTLKHVRTHQHDGVTLSSTGIDTNNANTWKIGGHDLIEVAHSAFATLREISRIESERPSPLAPNVDA